MFSNIPIHFVLRKKLRLIFVAFGCLSIPIVLYVRYVDKPFHSTIRLHVKSDSQTSALLSNNLIKGLFSNDEEKFLFSQQSLLKSYRVYEYVREREPEAFAVGESSALSKFTKELTQFVKIALFGERYTLDREKWRDPGFEDFLKRTSFDLNLGTGTISLGFQHRDPNRSLSVVKTLAEGLIEINSNIAQAQAKETAEFLRKKVQETTSLVEKTAGESAKFMKENRIIDNADIIQEQFTKYQNEMTEYQKANSDLIRNRILFQYDEELEKSLEEEIRSAKDAGKIESSDEIKLKIKAYKTAIKSSDNLDKRTLADLETRVSDLNAELGNVLQGSEPSMSIEALETLLMQTKSRRQARKAEIESLKESVAYMENIIADSRRDLAEYPELNMELGKYLFRLNKEKKVLEMLTEQYLVASIASDSRAGKLFVISPPRIVNSFKVGKPKTLLGALIIALIAVISFIAGRSIINETIVSRKQLWDYHGMKYMGAIPHFNAHPLTQILDSQLIDDRVIAIAQGIHTQCRIKRREQANTLVFCSARSGSGKSVTAALVAYSLASRGLKVALVDCDFRAQKKGISNTISTIDSKKTIHHLSEYRNTISIGSSFNNPEFQNGDVWVCDTFTDSEERSHFHHYIDAKFQGDLEQLKREMDYIIVDCPPIYFADTLSIIEQGDEIICCVPEGKTDMQELSTTTHYILQHKNKHAQIMSLLTDCTIGQNLGVGSESKSYYKARRVA